MKREILWYVLFLMIINAFGQHAHDTLLFSIALNDDTSSIYGCKWNDQVKSTLAGPVLMADKTLLFYSQNGYVLYSRKGKLLDSHSLIKDNKKAIKTGNAQLLLANPLDSATLLYYKESDSNQPVEIYQKKIFKKEMKKVSGAAYPVYSEMKSGQLFNLAGNSITDEMNHKTFLMPQLVGYTSLEGGVKWWTPDKFYSFSSPLIIEENGRCAGFFPGLKSDQEMEVKKHLIEPLGVFNMDGRWFYYGLYTPLGNIDDEYHQVVALCDQAGNNLYTSRLLKQEITDAVLQHVESSNTNFTVRRAARHVFVPAVDQEGDIYYGMIDFEYKRINVYKRQFYRFYATASGPKLQNLLSYENDLAFTPVTLECNSSSKRGVRPEITRLTDDGIVTLEESETTVNGYFTMVHRRLDDELKKKLARAQNAFPANLQKMQDSINALTTSWCPFSLSLNHNEKGSLSMLHYGLGEEIFCARILSATAAHEIFIRVDLEQWAEILVFSADGKFKNRFRFNKQSYRDRKDLVAISENGEIIEKDFECTKNGFRYFQWILGVADANK